ncbi:MAG: hypothetical protein WD004_00955 [Actinomycetota bacterium]
MRRSSTAGPLAYVLVGALAPAPAGASPGDGVWGAEYLAGNGESERAPWGNNRD